MPQTSSRDLASFSRREALRTIALTLGAAALPGSLGLVSNAARAASPTPLPSASPTPAPIASSSLGGRFSWISGLGGNIAVLGGDDGVLAVDSGLPNLTDKMAAELAKTGRVTHLVNTHWHYDHAGGNEVLAKDGAHITAHANCRKRLST